ncbi:hypothetical protein BGL_1c31360 [Burkholderia plantarii]|uniref:Uncharacterized protein n=1 Tax=Burkholderia plantarii TaxID=41899 RepID=A0A0B6RQJ4_BURPL|nr:hypothetical protein BGL_1c31360 [Burkholderia plantarii]
MPSGVGARPAMRATRSAWRRVGEHEAGAPRRLTVPIVPHALPPVLSHRGARTFPGTERPNPGRKPSPVPRAARIAEPFGTELRHRAEAAANACAATAASLPHRSRRVTPRTPTTNPTILPYPKEKGANRRRFHRLPAVPLNTPIDRRAARSL